MTAPDAQDVVVVGGGIGGVACARALTEAGTPVRVLERAHRVGGRMSSKPLPADAGRVVDLGAAYFTVRDDEFAAVAESWRRRGFAVPWTDTLASREPDGSWSSKSGPERWCAPGGLRTLVDDLARDLRISYGHTVTSVGPGPTVDGRPARAVVLAMPDPQAARLLDPALRAAPVVADRAWQPVISVALGFGHRSWEHLSAAFVNGHPDVDLIADDGDRRGDLAPVLVAHSTAERARQHLDDPDGAVVPVVAAVTELLGLSDAPAWTHAHRWSFASPAEPHDGEFSLDDDLVGLCGDGWGSPKVETAWRSGTLLGRAIADRVAG
ncbi:MAG: Renalase, oxidases 1,2-dihydro- and 1,6-dihydro-beta-NAD(P)H isomers back to NAD(P) [uncultured Actinomycetospora sp.]|uniref:Renalase, oxidases 1,2-dihydro- and 1,6-dihydro-beta-NAD(P)H isomers back to NAD(P) n=1 Tax=uncultured Actinomycetospora sp. TaxID=1135996 RepID=A0A6J4HTE0_9PSEU|nr:MAG: Renalase, oxidases 1,2-dihydro- and 1,6-dihydro-beta-NAD(P)H isomers back to NAD(P) [uncultured Actinomycetospora sp.]